MKHESLVSLAPLLLVVVGLSSFVVMAEEPAESKESPETARNAEVSPYMAATEAARQRRTAQNQVRVFTNEDLAQLSSPIGAAPPAPPTAEEQPPSAQAMDPLAYIQSLTAQKAKRQEQRSASQQQLEAARRRVTELENRLKGFRSPFKPYPQKPEDPAAAEGWDTETTAERIAATEAQLAEARSALRAAEANAAASGGRR